MPELLVRGHAEALLPPTDAILTVTVHVRAASSQAAAVDACARRCEEVDALVDARRPDLVRRAITSSMRTGPEWEHQTKGGRRLVGHTATRSTELDCAPDGAGLTALLHQVAALSEVQVAGPRWRVAPEAPGWSEVRAAAAADARARAEAFAGGLGLQVGRLVWLCEPGLRTSAAGGGHDVPMAFAAAAPRMRSGGGAPEEEEVVVRIQPEPLTVAVDVEAGFDLS